MLAYLLSLGWLLAQLILPPAMGLSEQFESVNCSNPFTELTSCGRISPNGCCAKGCVRNLRGRCVPEQCTTSWNAWLRKPVTMSCYFHWFLVIFAGIITAVMMGLVVCNVGFEIRRHLRQRRIQRFRRFRDLSGVSIGSTQC
ncbi:uncharacterized protein LOC128259441 [Drosophila gunungcola]|uniref:Uncharacterized protein n=1 Tax=Drosophila gunungcola TaxID=103775 RepID=A0A9P9YXG3_9MUSC|nr:uncharacterized protein LOC128259441 [Drosophila gunungcola]KAI8044715.1 hypothetical protein M5D96_000886 [Drosophila gunungcola]